MLLDSWESTSVARDAFGYLCPLPTICVHPELDGRMLHIIHSLIITDTLNQSKIEPHQNQTNYIQIRLLSQSQTIVKPKPIGRLHSLVTWYGINYAGKQIM